MSCIEVTDAMGGLLATLTDWPLPNDALEPLRQTPEWEQARAWGWIMESGELTGSGLAHVQDLPGGVVKD